MKRTFHEDILRCPRCKKDSLSIIAFITDITVVLKILKHLKLPTDAPKLDPARYPVAFELDFDDEAEPAQQFEPTPPELSHYAPRLWPDTQRIGEKAA
jgi:hypothetical protein